MTHYVKLDKQYLKIKFTSIEFKTLIFILSFSNQKKGCYASLNFMAQYLNEEKRAIIRAIKGLQEKNLIVVETHKATKGYKNPFNVYKAIALEALDELEAEAQENPLIEDVKKAHLKPRKGKKDEKKAKTSPKSTTTSNFNEMLNDSKNKSKIDISETESAKNKALDDARKKLIDN